MSTDAAAGAVPDCAGRGDGGYTDLRKGTTMRSSLLGDIECPVFVVTVQTLLLRGNVGVDDIARGMALACSVPPEAVMGRIALAAREYIGWVGAGMGDERKPAWWQD